MCIEDLYCNVVQWTVCSFLLLFFCFHCILGLGVLSVGSKFLMLLVTLCCVLLAQLKNCGKLLFKRFTDLWFLSVLELPERWCYRLLYYIKMTVGAEVSVEMASQPHVVIMPYPSKGHSIPILHFARKLSALGVTITFVNSYEHIKPKDFLSIEGLDKLRVMKIGGPVLPGDEIARPLPMVDASERIIQDFEELVGILICTPGLPRPACLLCDMFLGWTQVHISIECADSMYTNFACILHFGKCCLLFHQSSEAFNLVLIVF